MIGRGLAITMAFLVFWHDSSSEAVYRHIFVDHICKDSRKGLRQLLYDSGKDSLKIGEGAVIIQLRNPSKALQPHYGNSYSVCEINVQAPRGFGITVHVEEMHMRMSNGKCLDSVQFGRNDKIPFFTLSKSQPLCGEDRVKKVDGALLGGYFYKDPGGNLLVWITLGGRRKTSLHPHISAVNLTFVVTPYRRDCNWSSSSSSSGSRYRLCGPNVSSVCVLRDFFCDGHFNCPSVQVGNVSHSLSEERDCPSDMEPRSTSPPAPYETDLNTISWSLIFVSATFLVVLALVASAHARLSRRGCRKYCCCCAVHQEGDRGGDGHGETFEPRSLAELSYAGGSRHAREQNVYVALNAVCPTTAVGDGTLRPLELAEENPPPAYDDLFPEGRGALRTDAGSLEDERFLPDVVGGNAASEETDADGSQRPGGQDGGGQ